MINIAQRFGKLITIELQGKDKNYNKLWSCKCDCGTVSTVRQDHLLSGNTSSCGCGLAEYRQRKLTHHKLYKRWEQMMQRCTNPNVRNYRNYGGRGITVEEHLRNSENYIKYVSSLPNYHMVSMADFQVDREDNDGHYERGNLRIVSRGVNARNTRRKHRLQGPSGGNNGD